MTRSSRDEAASDEIVDALLAAYRRGWFPMVNPGETGPDGLGELAWYDPDPRGILPIGADDPAGTFHVPRRLARRVRSKPFLVTADRAFESVVRACAEPRADEPTSWIDERIVHAYTAMHLAGHAHSVEAWAPHPRRGPDAGFVLVGGVYGVSVGGLFAGESMFSKPDLGGTDASKVCLIHLVEHLRARGYTLFDTQFWNPHLDQFGCVEIPRADYRERLAAATARVVPWGAFEPITPET